MVYHDDFDDPLLLSIEIKTHLVFNQSIAFKFLKSDQSFKKKPAAVITAVSMRASGNVTL